MGLLTLLLLISLVHVCDVVLSSSCLDVFSMMVLLSCDYTSSFPCFGFLLMCMIILLPLLTRMLFSSKYVCVWVVEVAILLCASCSRYALKVLASGFSLVRVLWHPLLTICRLLSLFVYFFVLYPSLHAFIRVYIYIYIYI